MARKSKSKPRDPLVDAWEKILAKEGLSPIDSLFSTVVAPTKRKELGHAGIFTPLSPGQEPRPLHDSAKYAVWSRFAELIHQTELSPQHEFFLLEFAESGFREKARKTAGLTAAQARTVLANFCRLHGFRFRNGVLTLGKPTPPKAAPSDQPGEGATLAEKNAWAVANGRFPDSM